jgi:hypothetical protein
MEMALSRKGVVRCSKKLALVAASEPLGRAKRANSVTGDVNGTVGSVLKLMTTAVH